jgi:pimeloyl-ACP methyl ester carboxylesterase
MFTDAFDVAVHDQRGLGATDIPPGPYTMADYAADAAAFLDHLGWPTSRVLGISFGGMVAQELAVAWPHRVERLALLCTSPGGAGGASYPLHTMAAVPEHERAALALRLVDDRYTPEFLADNPRDASLAAFMAARSDADDTEEQRRGKAEQLAARAAHDVWDRLPAITCPTLVASGRHDALARPANGEAIASRIAGATFRVYEGGHLFILQDRAAVPDIVEFLGDVA